MASAEFRETPAARLDALLRGEIAAVETYNQAIERAADEHPLEAAALRQIAQEHGEAAQRLRQAIVRNGGRAENSSGAWGAYAKAVEGAATLLGNGSTLRALKEGELLGLAAYREAIERFGPSLPPWIQSDSIPTQERHVARLDEMIARLAR